MCIRDSLHATLCREPGQALRAAVVASIIAAAVFAAMTHWGRDHGGDLDQLGPLVEEALVIADRGVTDTLA